MEKTLVLIIFYFCIGIAIGLLIAKLKALKKKDVELELQYKIDTLKLEKEEITLENEKLKNLIEEKQNDITQHSIQNKFDKFCSRYKQDAIARIKVKTEDGAKEFTSFIDEKVVTQSMRKPHAGEYLLFGRIQSKTQNSARIYCSYSYMTDFYDEYYWCDGLIRPKDHAIDWKVTTMYIKLADLESVEIDKNMEEYI